MKIRAATVKERGGRSANAEQGEEAKRAGETPAVRWGNPFMSEQPVIRLEDVNKVFLTEQVETHALSDVALSIGRGEYVSIEGPSGCGKSTLLSIIGLLDSPTEGAIG